MFLLDSGAFTFFSSGKEVNWDEYIERYTDFIKANGVEYFFELDIDKLVGYERVKEFRRKIEMLTGKQSIPVWHKSRGKDEYLRLCDEYGYIAIGGLAAKDITPKEYAILPGMIKTAHKHGARVHGLGFTNVRKFEQIRFDSVDSTRWNCGRFGRIEYFDGKTMRSIDRRKDGKRLHESKRGEITRINLNEWIKFQEYADTHL